MTDSTPSRTIRVAACQMVTELADQAHNLELAETLIDEAFGRQAAWVVLPEFFSTGNAYHPAMDDAAVPLEGETLEFLRRAARRHQGHVGGSFLARRGDDVFNTFVWVGPDGSYSTHDKDIPTMWEGCYYRGGDDDGVIECGDLTVGAVLCWEFIRWQTARRLRGQVDVVLGGSAWFTYPELPGSWLLSGQQRRGDTIMHSSFSTFARIVGVPVVHAGMAGRIDGKMPYLPLPYRCNVLGHSQIIAADGTVLAQLDREQGAGVVVADIEVGEPKPSIELEEDGFWIPKMPWSQKLSWSVFNHHARGYYAKRNSGG